MNGISNCEQGKLSKTIFDIFSFCFFALFFALLISQCFFNNSTENYNAAIQLAAAVFVTAALILLYLVYVKFIKKGLDRLPLPRWLLPCVLGVLFVALQVLYVAMTRTQIGFDCRVVAVASHAPDPTYETEYFSRYPHVFSIFFLFRAYYSVLDVLIGAYEHWFVIDLLNIVAVDTAIFFSYKTAKLLFNKRIAKLSVVMSVLLFGLFPYLIVPWADVLAMPFTVISMYFFLKLLCEESALKKALFSVAAGASLSIGIRLKPSVIVIIVAVVIIYLFKCRASKKKALNISFIALAGIVAILGEFAYQGFIYSQSTIPIDKDKAIPWTCYLLVGSNSDSGNLGGWNGDDLTFVNGFETTEEMNEACVEGYKERVKAFGFGGYLRFLFDKARWITSEGNFFWGKEGLFANYDMSKPNIFKQFIYENGSLYNLTRYYLQGIWITAFLFIVYPAVEWAITKKRDRSFGVSLAQCVLVGIILLTLLLEGRSRYLILYLPYFAMLEAYGFSLFIDRIRKPSKNSKKDKTEA